MIKIIHLCSYSDDLHGWSEVTVVVLNKLVYLEDIHVWYVLNHQVHYVIRCVVHVCDVLNYLVHAQDVHVHDVHNGHVHEHGVFHHNVHVNYVLLKILLVILFMTSMFSNIMFLKPSIMMFMNHDVFNNIHEHDVFHHPVHVQALLSLAIITYW